MANVTDSNEEKLLAEFLKTLLKSCDQLAQTFSQAPVFDKQIPAEESQKYLVNLFRSAMVEMFTTIDGSTSPTNWPEIAIVNLETGRPLSRELDWAWSNAVFDWDKKEGKN